MRRWALLFIATWPLLAGCPSEPVAPPSLPDGGSAAIEIGRTATVAAASKTSSITGTTTVSEPEEPAGAPSGKKGCVKRAPWIEVAPCREGTFIYAVGHVAGIRNPSLARETASARARHTLARLRSAPETAPLRDSEIVRSERCGKHSYVLVRAPAEAGSTLELCAASIAHAAGGSGR